MQILFLEGECVPGNFRPLIDALVILALYWDCRRLQSRRKAGFLTDYNGRSQSQLTIIISLSEIYFWELALARVLDLGEDRCLDLLLY